MVVKSGLRGQDLGATSRELFVNGSGWWMKSYRVSQKIQGIGNHAPGNEDLKGRGKIRSLRWEIKPIQRGKGE